VLAQAEPAKAGESAGEAPLGELRELKKEVEGSRALTIKTHNLIGQLSAEIKQVSQRQNRYERGLSLNSFVAYVLFTLLLGGAFALLYRSRASSLVLERDTARQERDAAKEHDRQTESAASARATAQEKARQFYELVASGKKSDVIAQYPDVARLALSPVEAAVFRASFEEAKASLTTSEFNAGKDAFANQQWKKAVAAFKRATLYEAPGPRMNEVHYYLGISLYHLGEYQEAASHLDTAQQANIERGIGGDVDYFLAASYDMLRQLDKAKALYERYFSRHEGTPLSKLARRRLIALSQAKGAAPPLTP
jgi:TolA-binding protein